MKYLVTLFTKEELEFIQICLGEKVVNDKKKTAESREVIDTAKRIINDIEKNLSKGR